MTENCYLKTKPFSTPCGYTRNIRRTDSEIRAVTGQTVGTLSEETPVRVSKMLQVQTHGFTRLDSCNVIDRYTQESIHDMGMCEHSSILGYYTGLTSKQLEAFRRSVVPPYLG